MKSFLCRLFSPHRKPFQKLIPLSSGSRSQDFKYQCDCSLSSKAVSRYIMKLVWLCVTAKQMQGTGVAASKVKITVPFKVTGFIFSKIVCQSLYSSPNRWTCCDQTWYAGMPFVHTVSHKKFKLLPWIKNVGLSLTRACHLYSHLGEKTGKLSATDFLFFL